MAKNKLKDLNDHLFMALERLNDEGEEKLKGEALSEELERSKAISGLARDIISAGALQLKAHVAYNDNLIGKTSGLLLIEDKDDG